ncbi:MAG: TRAP transporter large permease subunit [Burkholderiales bacterium]|nr:TRAP transporter large permease subunit [Burkholderiales bacterium]
MRRRRIALTSRVKSLLDRLDEVAVLATRRVAFVGVLGMLVVAFAQVLDVLLRWFANSPIDGLNEAVGLAIGVAVAATFPAGAAQRVNLAIDLLGGRVPPRLLAWLKVLAGLLLLLFYVLLAWRVGAYAAKLAERNASTVYLHLPMAPFMWLVAFFLGCAALVQAIAWLVTLRFALAGLPDPIGWSIGQEDGVQAPRPGVSVPDRRLATAAVLLVLALGALLYLLPGTLAPLMAFAQPHGGTLATAVVVLLWVLLVLYVPLAATMGLLGVLTTVLFIGLEPALNVVGNESIQFLTNAQVAVLPMFLMMGAFAVVAGMSSDIYALAHTLLAHLRGGLALATIGGCGGFGALTGSSLATVATLGRVALPEMGARGYSQSLAMGTVAAGGTLGALVPPSIPLIFYAFLTEQSIGKLFIAAMVPAAMAIVFYLAAVAIVVRVVPGSAPPASTRAELPSIARALKRAWGVLTLFAVVLGGIYSGVCTETEAAAIGAGGAFLFALARGKINRRTFAAVMGETTGITAMLYVIIFGVLLFSFSLGVTGLPQRMTEYFQGLQVEPILVILMLLAIYLALGCIMDSNTVMFVTTPLIAPLVAGVGYDLVWWGVIMLIVLETGLITPPFGIHLFVLKSIGGGADVPLKRVYAGVIPFVIADFVKLLLIVVFPALALWLPASMVSK